MPFHNRIPGEPVGVILSSDKNLKGSTCKGRHVARDLQSRVKNKTNSRF